MQDGREDAIFENVSRETLAKLEHLASLLKKWNPKINLVANSTISELWQRHIADTVQVFNAAPTDWSHWVDVGSGGGFPGLVVAVVELWCPK